MDVSHKTDLNDSLAKHMGAYKLQQLFYPSFVIVCVLTVDAILDLSKCVWFHRIPCLYFWFSACISPWAVLFAQRHGDKLDISAADMCYCLNALLESSSDLSSGQVAASGQLTSAEYYSQWTRNFWVAVDALSRCGWFSTRGPHGCLCGIWIHVVS